MMAMTDIEKRHFRSAMSHNPLATEIITVIDSGSAAALPANSRHLLRSVFTDINVALSFQNAIETGSALSDLAIAQLKQLCGRADIGASIATQINALT